MTVVVFVNYLHLSSSLSSSSRFENWLLTLNRRRRILLGLGSMVLLCFLIQLGRSTGLSLSHPGAVLLLGTLAIEYLLGFAAGVWCSFVGCLYLVLYFSLPGPWLHFDPYGLGEILSWSVTLPASVVLLGLLKQRMELQYAILMKSFRANEKLAQTENKLRLILQSVDIGVWEWDLLTNTLTWDDGMCRIYGVHPDELSHTYKDWEDKIHPDDKEKTYHEFSEAVRLRRTYKLRFRIVQPSGQIRYIESRSQISYSPDGQVSRVVGVNWDATDQALAGEELAFQKNINEAILEHIPIGVFVKDVRDQCRIIICNRALEELVDTPKAQLIGKTDYQILPQENADRYALDDQRALREGQLIDIPEEPIYIEKKGIRYLHSKKLPLRIDSEEVPRYLLCITEDITERKQAREEEQRHQFRIRSLNQRLSLAVLGAGFGVWEFDLESHKLIWDDLMYQLYGHSRSSFDGSTEAWRACLLPEDRDLVDSRFGDLLNGIPVDLFEFRAVRFNDGKLRYVEANGYLQLDHEGKPLKLVGMNRDITERKLVEHARKKSEMLFRTMFESAPLGIALINSITGQIREVNPSFAAIAGRTIEEMKRITWMEITHPDDVQPGLDFMAPLNAGVIQSFKMSKRYLKPDGSLVWIDMAIAILVREDGAEPLHLCMIEDVSERKRVEDELKKAKELAEESTQVKSTFMANMSHEIRTPLAVIRGYAELLMGQGGQSETAKEWTSNILRSSQQLELLLGDILDLSKVESGKIPLEFAPLSLPQILAEIRSLLHVSASAKGIDLNFLVQGSIPETITTDVARFKQILINVVSNAIKFTEHGQVDVITSLQASSPSDGQPTILFEIKDTGIGISLQQREKIFEIFTQADSSITRRFGGTGLGLTLSRHLARLLGGDVNLGESVINKGTTFLVTVAAGPLEGVNMVNTIEASKPSYMSHNPADGDAIDLAGFRILLVEDAPDLRALFSLVLESQGAQVKTAANGMEGIAKTREDTFDIILMDIQMPVLGGYEATRQLRIEGIDTPIIALTAHAMKGERERCLEAGFNDHLAKPVDVQKLMQMIVKYRESKRQCPSPPSHTPIVLKV